MAPNPLIAHHDITSQKKFYFIRHGQSMGNVGLAKIGEGDPLSEKGRQASFMAERAAKLPLEVLIASTVQRAQETAEIISSACGLKMESTKLLIERIRPSVQQGKLRGDPFSLEIDTAIANNFAVPGYRHSDEENFDDLKKRAGEVLEYLGNRSEEHVGVVTHGFFMRILLARVVFGEQLTGHECESFIRSFHMENTGLTIISFDGWEKKNPWWVWTWNDHAHLG